MTKRSIAESVTLQVGYWVALSLAPGAAPIRSYVGQVEAVDTHGVRITLVDWFNGLPVSWDLFVPWASITAALVGTPAHHTESFGKAGAKWQERMAQLGGEAPEASDPPPWPKDWFLAEENPLRSAARSSAPTLAKGTVALFEKLKKVLVARYGEDTDEYRIAPTTLLKLLQAEGFASIRSTKKLANVLQPLGFVSGSTTINGQKGVRAYTIRRPEFDRVPMTDPRVEQSKG